MGLVEVVSCIIIILIHTHKKISVIVNKNRIKKVVGVLGAICRRMIPVAGMSVHAVYPKYVTAFFLY